MKDAKNGITMTFLKVCAYLDKNDKNVKYVSIKLLNNLSPVI